MKNEKIIFWKINRHKKNAYKDQYGVPHKAVVVEEEIVATIVEDKVLQILGSNYSKTFATKAKSEDGRFFRLSRDWGSTWYETNFEFTEVKAEFEDAIDEFNRTKWRESRLSENGYVLPLIRENGDLAIPQNVEICTCPHSESHHAMKFHYYYKPNGHCDCFFLKKS